MEESRRQKQVNKLLEQELNEIFQRRGWNIFGKGLLSIARVKITSDLSLARIYLSMFQIEDNKKLMGEMASKNREIRKDLGIRLKNQLRKIPELSFHLDDTLDYVDRIEEVLKRVRKDENT